MDEARAVRISWMVIGGIMRQRDPVFAGLLLAASCHDPADDALARIQVTPEAGGHLVSPSGRFTLEVPPGAVQATTEIAVREIPNDDAVGGVAYDLSPDGLTFDVPASATFARTLVTTGSATEVALGVPRSSSRGELEFLADVQTTLDLVAGTLTTTGTMAHFSEAAEAEAGVVNVNEAGGEIQFQVGINTDKFDTIQVGFGGCSVSNLGLEGVSVVNGSASTNVSVSCDSVAGQVQRAAETAPDGFSNLNLRCGVDVVARDASAQPLSSHVSVDSHVPCTPEQVLAAPCFEPFGTRIAPTVTGGCPNPAPVSISGGYHVDRGVEEGAFQVGLTLQSDSAERPFASQLELRGGEGSLFVGVFEGADLQPSYSAFVVDPQGTIVATLQPAGTRSDAGTYSVNLMLQGSLLNTISTAKIHYTGDACFGETEIALAPLAKCPWKP